MHEDRGHRHDDALDAGLRDLLAGDGFDADLAGDLVLPDDDVVDAYLDGRADAAQIRAVRRAMQGSATFREEVLTQAELRRDLAGDALRRDMAAVHVPADLWGAAQATKQRPSGLARLFWRPAAGYATAAVLAALLVLSTTRPDVPTPAVGEVRVPRYHLLRAEDEPVPVVALPAGDVVDLVVAGEGPASGVAYQATLRRLDDGHIEAYVAAARRDPDGGGLVLRVDRDLLRPGTAYAVVFSPVSRTDRSADRGLGTTADVVGRFQVADPRN